ncbi:MAG: hypothetical protein QG628_634 [Patescibacteria group bacterium]|jgi:hypothetical protein|nr:hypothetical protein [Patescibacteria group bacterium]
MYKTKPTRREAMTIPPAGGIFLCLNETVPEYIRTGIQTLEEERVRSAAAQVRLDRELELGKARRAGTMLMTYGKELEAYVLDREAKPDERSLDAKIVKSVETIEYLYDLSSVYLGTVDAIRLTANRAGTEIVTQMELGDRIHLGNNDYTRQTGPFDYEFLCRDNGDNHPLTLFDWDGEADGTTFVRAQFGDQVMLLQDVIAYASE